MVAGLATDAARLSRSKQPYVAGRGLACKSGPSIVSSGRRCGDSLGGEPDRRPVSLAAAWQLPPATRSSAPSGHRPVAPRPPVMGRSRRLAAGGGLPAAGYNVAAQHEPLRMPARERLRHGGADARRWPSTRTESVFVSGKSGLWRPKPVSFAWCLTTGWCFALLRSPTSPRWQSGPNAQRCAVASREGRPGRRGSAPQQDRVGARCEPPEPRAHTRRAWLRAPAARQDALVGLQGRAMACDPTRPSRPARGDVPEALAPVAQPAPTTPRLCAPSRWRYERCRR